MQEFICFESANPFWVGGRMDIWDDEQMSKLWGIVPEISVRMDADRFSAAVCVDGLLLLSVRHLAEDVPTMSDPANFEASVRWWDEHLDYANALLTLLESETLASRESGHVASLGVSQPDAGVVRMKSGMPVNALSSGTRSPITGRTMVKEWVQGGRIGQPPTDYAHSKHSSVTVPENVVLSALHIFELACDDPLLVWSLSFVAKAKSAFSRNDFRAAFVMLWFVVETNARRWWDETGRKGEGVPVYRVFADLHAEGVLTEENLARLDRLRKEVRNPLIHESYGALCMPLHCTELADLVLTMITKVKGLTIFSKWPCCVSY